MKMLLSLVLLSGIFVSFAQEREIYGTKIGVDIVDINDFDVNYTLSQDYGGGYELYKSNTKIFLDIKTGVECYVKCSNQQDLSYYKNLTIKDHKVEAINIIKNMTEAEANSEIADLSKKWGSYNTLFDGREEPTVVVFQPISGDEDIGRIIYSHYSGITLIDFYSKKFDAYMQKLEAQE
ncbi:hypothetical protein MMG00_12160 [Ignatzschineria rhizosphaerae]|uniref:Uncharacterized protein n=1 Tax=Ignatzschineria rhizosphaerae TaxID=2923279 RepID=A0ABY3WZA1_9GAMM|nr:hypothetical protein [Ignatzschineria rhizosphaerae]UNM95939.1 hypothetical protein MMG00_12160 [Ignatzschineria rhizosphaerae]